MFKLQRLEISGFKSFADYTEIVFTGSGITAVVGPNGCGKSNVSDAMSWVLGEQRAKSLRGGEMKDVVFAGTRSRKPGGMAEVVLHLVRDDSVFDADDNELSDIDQALSGIDEAAVDMDEIEGVEEIEEIVAEVPEEMNGHQSDQAADGELAETALAMAVGSAQVVETKVKTKRHWRPRSFALDFAPGEAVSVTRRLYLSGESEYQLNGKTCRLRDITDLFAGTGLSGAHYAIIEQGRIGQILSAKPADRRNLIEEAAGISKFRARQRAAESRLDSAKTNLSRIFDIISEIETQVNSLRRQAAKTRRFKILQEEFRSLLRQLYAAEGKYLSDLSNQLKLELGRAEETETELHAKVKAQEEATREATQQARDAEENLAELRKIHANNILERDRAEREHLYKSDQIVSLNSRCDTLRSEIAASKDRLRSLEGELANLKEDERKETEAYAQAEAELRSSEDAHREESSALAAIESSIDTLRAELMQHNAAAERFDEIGRQLTNNLERLEMRADGLEREGARAEETFEANQKQAETLARDLAAEEQKLAALNAEKDVLIADTTESRSSLRTAEESLRVLHDEHAAKRHRLETLRELEEKKAVYAPQVQKLFAEQAKIGVRFAGVLADRLNVASEAETAVETLFGPFLEAIVVESKADAKAVADWMRQNDIGRTAMIVLPTDTNADGALTPNGTIASHLGVSKLIADALSEIFPREMSARLVDAMDGVSAKPGEMIIDRSGDLALGGRMFVSGKRKTDGKNTSLLAFKRELNQLAKECSRLDNAIESAKIDVEKARAVLVENESKTVDLQSLIIKVDRGIHGLQIQVHSAREEIARAERHRKVVADETTQIASEIADLKERREEALQNKVSAQAARSQTEAALDTVGLDLATARQKAEAAIGVLNEKRMIAATSDERRRSAVSALRRVENETREIESRIAVLDLELSENDAKIKALHESIIEITDRIASSGEDIAKEDSDLAAAVTALAAARDLSDTMSEGLAELNRQTVEARSQKAEIEIKQAEAVTELRNTSENCQQELNVSLVELIDTVELDAIFSLETARRDADDLREKLDNFGAINMLALEELAEAEERHLFLTSQRTDIVDSIAATEEALREIKQRSRERFKAAFEAINENFKEFFVELFGGGRGEMTLLEADDILEAGIEVVAQPPGKRLQNIMLLSGGEKAMTAIALVLAIFKYRPSPFCLLDEVDAPLDDANVGRFAAKIAEMSEKTQFIVITHNKRTMESARALYGVTMQEAGVSKIVSVKFE